ncbi:arginine--tRNA ligase [bacterium]|nr:arginine--tRNA ligase [bacterium]
MLKEYFLEKVTETVKKLTENNQLGQMKNTDEFSLQAEIPKNAQFGDFAVNVSSLSRYAKLPPVKIAEEIAKNIATTDFDINVTAGFINFKLHNNMLNSIIAEVLEKKLDYAKNNQGNGKKVILEYVSANPTGPFHIGHGRWAAMGSALANVMLYSGYDVYQEFYINDAGSQIQKLGKSLYIRILKELGVNIDFPEDEEEAKNYYTGEYLIPVAKEFIEKEVKKAEEIKNNYKCDFDKEDLKYLSKYARLKMLSLQKELLENFNTHFDNYFSELTLHEAGKVEECIKKLDELGVLYNKDGALWFASSKYGDDQDRVIKKSDGAYTYLTADIAYHYNKLQRGFDTLLNIWGADHHGYIPRMKAAIEVLGYNPDSLEVLLGQLVNLVMNGEQVRMGKRTKMITLDELIDEVGVDATRYWMIMRSIDTTLDFDVELAKSKTDENPVFYVQYAHARACSILRHAMQEKFDVINKTLQKPSVENIDEIIKIMKADNFEILWKTDDEKSLETTKKLILKLEEFKFIVQNAAKNRTPYLLTKYLQELSANFHQFYTFSKVLVDDEKLMFARLSLVKAVTIILEAALKLIAVSAPERM